MYNLDGKLAAPPIKRSLSLSLSTSPQHIDGPLMDCLFGNRGCNSKSSKIDSLCSMSLMFLVSENRGGLLRVLLFWALYSEGSLMVIFWLDFMELNRWTFPFLHLTISSSTVRLSPRPKDRVVSFEDSQPLTGLISLNWISPLLITFTLAPIAWVFFFDPISLMDILLLVVLFLRRVCHLILIIFKTITNSF